MDQACLVRALCHGTSPTKEHCAERRNTVAHSPHTHVRGKRRNGVAPREHEPVASPSAVLRFLAARLAGSTRWLGDGATGKLLGKAFWATCTAASEVLVHVHSCMRGHLNAIALIQKSHYLDPRPFAYAMQGSVRGPEHLRYCASFAAMHASSVRHRALRRARRLSKPILGHQPPPNPIDIGIAKIDPADRVTATIHR